MKRPPLFQLSTVRACREHSCQSGFRTGFCESKLPQLIANPQADCIAVNFRFFIGPEFS